MRWRRSRANILTGVARDDAVVRDDVVECVEGG